MIPGSVRRPARMGVGVLALLIALVCGIAFARPALAEANTVELCGLTFSYDGSSQASSVVTSRESGVVNVDAPAGTITISGTAKSEEFKQIVVGSTNTAKIRLGGVHIDEFNDADPRHSIILNADTDLEVSGSNSIFARNTFSAIWSERKLTIRGASADDTLTLYDASHANAAISIITKDLVVGQKGSAGPTINGLLLGGSLRGITTYLTGTLTIEGGTINAENTAGYQQALSAGTLTINGGTVKATMSGNKSHAISATSLVVAGGTVEASGTGASSNGINAGSVTLRNGTGTEGSGPTLKVTGNQSAIGCPVAFRASTVGEDDFFPWLAQGGEKSGDALGVLSFAGAGNTQTAESTGISLGAKYVEVKPVKLASLQFTPSSSQGDDGTPGATASGVKAGNKVYLDLSYAFEGSGDGQPAIEPSALTTFFPVVADAISPMGNAITAYSGGTQGSITFLEGAKGRTTSISPEPWGLLEKVYGNGAKDVVKPLEFPMRYEISFDLNGGKLDGNETASPLTTDVHGKVTVSSGSTLTKEGFTFAYWREGDGANSAAITDLETHVFNEAVTLTAEWVSTSATITFDGNGGTWGEAKQQALTVEQGSDFYAPSTEPTKSGEVFLGWTKDGEASELVTFPQQVSSGTPSAKYLAQWGTPSLTLEPSNATPSASTPDAKSKVTFTATATTDSSLGSVTLAAGDVSMVVDPLCEVEDMVVSGNTATFSVVAPEVNGTVAVTASWAGTSATSSFTVSNGIDPVYVTFQGNGGTWDDNVPFQTIMLDRKDPELTSDQISQLGTPVNSGNSFLAWYEWRVEADATASGNGVAATHGYWHSVKLEGREFSEDTTLTAMWGSESATSLLVWPPSKTVRPSEIASYTVAILPEPTQTGVLPPEDYAPAEGNKVEPEKLGLAFIEGEDYGAKFGKAAEGNAALGNPSTTATFEVITPSSATPADSRGIVIQATYPKDAREGSGTLEATATLTVVANSSPSNPPKPTPSTPSIPSTDESVVAVHRLYNPYDGSHLLTIDAEEIRRLVPHGWKDEGEAFRLFSENREGRVPITRLYNPFNGDHHYVTSASEAHMLALSGWIDEGTCFYGASPDDGAPVYRLWNSLQRAHGGLGSHLWTSESHEYAKLPTLDPAGAWKQEGIAWYAAHTAPTQ